jgi:signal transduction histidine kinase/CheY-like chemotaxis protein/HPt (histidine-containing phosphotransfer) domain-containing protein
MHKPTSNNDLFGAHFKELVVRIIFVEFLAEAFVMVLLPLLGEIPYYVETVLDASILTMISSPIIYVWIIRPYILGRNAAEEMANIASTERINAAEEHSREMDEAVKAAKVAAKAKSEFLANMSHEIRTPMHGIMGLTQLALSQSTNPVVEHYLSKSLSSAQSLLGILNDILDFSKMEVGRMSIENTSFELKTILDNLTNLFSMRADEKKLGFEIIVSTDIPQSFIGDALRIQQVLANLLGNAIKFTNQGHITLDIGFKRIQESRASLTFNVRDTGIGIADHDLKKLFQPFSQVDDSITRRFGGTGLGLAISQNLLQLMGSELFVTSEHGKGTNFTFELELAYTEKQKSIEKDSRTSYVSKSIFADMAGKDLLGTRVLVVEDNMINQLVVSDILKLSGMVVEIADNGLEALNILDKQSFDVILMDIQMPIMGGLEATRNIRNQRGDTKTPIFALSAGVTMNEREKCFACGMNDFLPKPFNPEDLINALKKWVEKDTEKVEPVVLKAVEPEPKVSIPEFDLDDLIDKLAGNHDMVIKMLLSFKQDNPKITEEIISSLARNEIDFAENLLHTMKGVAGFLCAKELFEVSERFDNALKQKDFQPEMLTEWLEANKRTMVAITNILGESN